MKLTIKTHPEFSREELTRYSRQLLMPEWGEAGQKAVRQATVAIIGVGGLGCPAARYLAASGVGTLRLVDDDIVSASNLHRQLLFYPADVGQPKTSVAAKRLSEQFPGTHCEAIPAKATPANVDDLVRGADVVIDATDNFTSRYLINDACVRMNVPLCYASIGKFSGQASVFMPSGPCYRCLFPEPPPSGAIANCDVAGVIGVLPGTMALIQATEALKLIVGTGHSLTGRVLLYDSLQMSFQTFKLSVLKGCVACDPANTSAPMQVTNAPTTMNKEVSEDENTKTIPQITPAELTELPDDAILVDVRESPERKIITVEPSRHLPLTELQLGVPDDQGLENLLGDKNRPVVMLCKTGIRAQKSAELLQAKGYGNVLVLAGGIVAYDAFANGQGSVHSALY